MAPGLSNAEKRKYFVVLASMGLVAVAGFFYVSHPPIVVDVLGTKVKSPSGCTLENDGTHLFCGNDELMWKTSARGAMSVDELIDGYQRGGKIHVVGRRPEACTSRGLAATCTLVHMTSDGAADGFAHHVLRGDGDMIICFSDSELVPDLCRSVVHLGG